MTAKVANIRGYAVEKLLISSGHKMKNISCFIQLLVHTPPFLKLANEQATYLLRAINSPYTLLTALLEDLFFHNQGYQQ